MKNANSLQFKQREQWFDRFKKIPTSISPTLSGQYGFGRIMRYPWASIGYTMYKCRIRNSATVVLIFLNVLNRRSQ